MPSMCPSIHLVSFCLITLCCLNMLCHSLPMFTWFHNIKQYHYSTLGYLVIWVNIQFSSTMVHFGCGTLSPQQIPHKYMLCSVVPLLDSQKASLETSCASCLSAVLVMLGPQSVPTFLLPLLNMIICIILSLCVAYHNFYFYTQNFII